jgi:nucleoside-diphosphate-sugar epimerase
MTALVTGGGGFLGGAIVRMLRERGQEVRSFSRNVYAHLYDADVEQAVGDLSDMESVELAMADCDIVYHVAARAGVWGRYDDFHSTNVIGTQNILNACREFGVRKLVYTSSPSVVYSRGDMEGVDESAPYPQRFDAHYPRTKALAEQMVLAANGPDLATVALRPHLIWGPGDPHLIPRLLERARAGKLKRIGSGANRVDVTYVDNAAHAHVLAGERLEPDSPIAGKAYFLSQGEPVNLWDFINRVLAVAGLPPVTKSISFRKALFAGAILENFYTLFRLRSEPPMTRFVARQLATSHWFDISAARRDLGYEPIVSVDEGLRRLGESLANASAPG